MFTLVLIVLAGGVGGALLGGTRLCETGGCPLTATPWRGAIFGALAAGAIGVALLGVPRPRGGGPGAGSAEMPAELSPHLLSVASSTEFETEVLKAPGPVLVDFYADWCGPCRMLLPAISELADEWAGSVKVVKVNVDKAPDVARAHGVSSIPDVRIFVGGEQKEKLVGVQDKSVYIDRVNRHRPAATAPAVVPKAE